MPSALKTHSAAFVQTAARRLLDTGLAPETVFKGTRFDLPFLQEDAPAAPFQDITGFFENAAKISGDDLFGFHLGQDADLRAAGLATYAGLASEDAGGFLENFTRYIPVYSTAVEADSRRLYPEGLFEWRYRLLPDVPIRQYTEFAAASLLQTLRNATQYRIEPRQLRLQHRSHPGAAELESAFGCRVGFGAARNGIVFEPADLARPLASADAMLLKVLKACGEQELQHSDQHSPGLSSAVERAIEARLSQGSATLDTVAADLGMSPRTLSRRLSQEGTSYFTILEELRKLLAMRYLADRDLVLAEIAFLLGYSSLSSFNDAFKRWTGRSPGQYRSK